MVEFDDVASFVTLRVVRLARAFEKHIDVYLRSMADIGFQDWRVIVLSHRFGESRPIDLADRLGSELGSVLSILARLEEVGYLECKLSDNGVEYHPTEKGVDLFHLLYPLLQNRQKRIVEKLGSEELDIFSDVLDQLQERMDDLTDISGSVTAGEFSANEEDPKEQEAKAVAALHS